MRISLKKAMAFFKERALPRRIRDLKAEELTFQKTGKREIIYRRISPDDTDRGELYPLFHNGMDTFAHFGIGLGIYFAQLVILAALTFLCGMIMVVAAVEYQKDGFGGYGLNKPIPFAAVCKSEKVIATINCPDGATSCTRSYRPNCELPFNSAAADLAMCIVFCLGIIASKFVEDKIEQKLDESVQTAKDYSVEVLDPDHDADNPTEWYEYFKQFGDVKYVTILRRNNELTELILRKHSVVRKIQESGRMSSKHSARVKRLHRKYEKIDNEIAKAFEKTYPVCKVYVTYDSEIDQHRCLNSLEVPDYRAIFDIKEYSAKEHVFRTNVLDVREPAEPDNILWQNVVVAQSTARSKNLLAFGCYVLLLVAIWYVVQSVRSVALALLPLLIGFVDSILPSIFERLTDWHHPRSEGGKQNSLQMRLFCARVLLAAIIPYIVLPWEQLLTEEFTSTIFTVQIAACFFSPMLDLSDWSGLFQRHYISVKFSDTQEEMNSMWTGSDWSIAEKYTGIAKVIFLSLFYALIAPLTILIATIAFIAIFFIHNFLLLRRWKATSMLDSKIASRLRQQAVLSIAAHMLVTFRFIYSWPMDGVWYDKSRSAYVAVNKEPSYLFWSLKTQEWMSEGQVSIFYHYQVLLIIIAIGAFWNLIFYPFAATIFQFLCKSIRVSNGDVDSLRFSAVESIRIYYPMLKWDEEQYLCSYAKNVLPKHRPVLIDSTNIEKDDLSVYVPVGLQEKVLSIVEYFGVDPILRYEEEKIIDFGDLPTVPGTRTKLKKQFKVNLGGSMQVALDQVNEAARRRKQQIMYHFGHRRAQNMKALPFSIGSQSESLDMHDNHHQPHPHHQHPPTLQNQLIVDRARFQSNAGDIEMGGANNNDDDSIQLPDTAPASKPLPVLILPISQHKQDKDTELDRAIPQEHLIVIANAPEGNKRSAKVAVINHDYDHHHSADHPSKAVSHKPSFSSIAAAAKAPSTKAELMTKDDDDNRVEAAAADEHKPSLGKEEVGRLPIGSINHRGAEDKPEVALSDKADHKAATAVAPFIVEHKSYRTTSPRPLPLDAPDQSRKESADAALVLVKRSKSGDEHAEPESSSKKRTEHEAPLIVAKPTQDDLIDEDDDDDAMMNVDFDKDERTTNK